MLNFLASCCSVLALLLTLRSPELVFTHVTLIDGTGAPARIDMTVVARDSTIVLVRPSRGYTPPARARVIDGRGKFLLPGFVDTHAHVNVGPEHLDSEKNQLRGEYDPEVARVSLASLLRFGVTTIRDPGGLTEHAIATRDSVARGLIEGPRMFVAGSVIDQTDAPGLVATVHSPEEVRAEVRRQIAAGVDYIKLYATLTPQMVDAGIQEAHAAGKKAIGHLFLTSWTDAARAGIDALVHVTPSNPMLLPPDSRIAFRKGIHNTRFMFQWFEYVNLGSPEIDTMIAEMVKHHVEHDGTLATFEAMAWGDSARITLDPDLTYAAPSLVHNWQTFTLTQGWTKADYDSARAVWPKVLQFEKLLYDRGVPLTVGTDANNPWTVPGASYSRELELLVAAGISPSEVLRLATKAGADALGSRDVGIVQQGKRADLVLLASDPIADIRHTRDIVLVVANGRIVVSSDRGP
ncbi:MAG TPA: amidohydrolase family protein [Gemmatimonadaceae bacterium]|nr:amidohydrolase family protein [Gemmatimonadaceae bacterium]